MPTLLETQFPIAQLSLESYLERDAKGAKVLSTLGKWWGAKPVVLTRAIVLASLFEASDDPDRWPDDLEIFLRLMCLDNAGMWKRRNPNLSANGTETPDFHTLCFPQASEKDQDLFAEDGKWKRKLTDEQKKRRAALEKRVFYSVNHALQRRYTGRVEEIDGPPEESWTEINAYCGTTAKNLREWVEQMSKRRFGHTLRVGDSFSGSGSIPFEAAELGCDVYASDLNPVACLITWGALKIIAGDPAFHESVLKAQKKLYADISNWYRKEGLETSAEGWRAEAYLYCVETTVPEWDGWRIPLSGSWEIAPKLGAWVELVPDTKNKRFDFKVRFDKEGLPAARKATRQGGDVVCPQVLWDILHTQKKTDNARRQIPLDHLIEAHGGLRRWEKTDIAPRDGDFFGERLYCIRWRKPAEYDAAGNEIAPDELIYRAPSAHDLAIEDQIFKTVTKHLPKWQEAGFVPNWRILNGYNTNQPQRERGWTHWHHLFTPRQLLMAAEYSKRIANVDPKVAPALLLNFGRILDNNARLSRWKVSQGGGIGGTVSVFYNMALNTFPNFASRGVSGLVPQFMGEHKNIATKCNKGVELADAREITTNCDLWITDPPYADAVNYDELSEFFLAWYQPHLKACFPDWYTDSKRDEAVKGDDAPFRVAMAECYSRLASKMPENGTQVLMFTHKDTDVWEDLAMIMWAAGLQVKQVWSVATETPGAGIRVGNYVQATYNMVLRKRPANAPMGFVDLVLPEIKTRVEKTIRHMRDSQLVAGVHGCGYTDTDYLLAAQAVAAEVVTGFSSIDGIDLMEELRTPNKQRGSSVLRDLMNQAKRTAVDFLVPLGLEEQLRRTPDGGSAYQFWRTLAPEEKFLLKSLELEAGGATKVGTFQDLGRAYGLADYSELLGRAEANDARTKLPAEFPRPGATRWEDVPAGQRGEFPHSVTRQLYHALKLLGDGADAERAVKHLVETTNFWTERQTRHLVLLGYIHQATEPNEAWVEVRPLIQTLRLAVENHRG
jgi:putative DNA methylase